MNIIQQGTGILIDLLDSEDISVIKSCIGKEINKVYLDEEDNLLVFEFSDKSKLCLWDDGQSCCEDRYMRTDDDLSEYEGSILLDFELKDAPEQECEYGVHEVQFLDVKIDKGIFQMCSHNKHNGFYGGFLIRAKYLYQ